MEPLGPGTSSAEVITGGDDGSRLTEFSDRFRAGRGPWWQRHRRQVAAVLGAVVVTGAAAGAWRLAHPPTLAIPTITIKLDPTSTPSVGAPGVNTVDPASLVIPLLVDASPGDGVTVTFLGLGGAGLAQADPVTVPVDGTARTVVVAGLTCAEKQDRSPVVGSFEVSDGTVGERVVVPLSTGGLTRLTEAADNACRAQSGERPLTSAGVAIAPDPVEPVVQLDWTVNNSRDDAVVVDGLSLASDGGGPSPVLPGIVEGELTVPPGGTASIRTSLRVTSCEDPGLIDPNGQRLALTGRSTGGTEWQGDVELPAADLRRVFAIASTVCDGAPEVGGVLATASRAGSGAAARVTLTVGGELGSPGRWTVALTEPVWWVGDRAFPATTSTVIGPGDFSVSGSYASPACPDLASQGSFPTLAITMTSEGRVYPFLAPLGSPPDPGRSACRVSGR